ncbi:MAG: alpha-glucan family phosphorylase [Syntrophales bacterium]|jgi:phosphorylase/glycogen(starch) synthase|nr:alpha-glucan family phosphorylase [Syntrophales bacterium]
MAKQRSGYLFEISWEVCNKVGGIYTVVASKLREAAQYYGDQYLLFGPDLKTNIDFEETDEECWPRLREAAAIKEISCRCGRWKVPGDPRVILVSAGSKYNKEQLLYRIWEDYGVDSIAGGWDYIEPVMFSYACGEVIEIAYNLLARPHNLPAVAQVHEWMCGAALLCLKKRVPEIGTVFTTHATILGRSMAGSGVDIYTDMERISPKREASTHNITAKYSMETVSAREADCFTTVSEITAVEAKNFLGRAPDVITTNGLDMEHIPDLAQDRAPALHTREKLLAAASRFLRKNISPTTKIMVISGRYEFHNKGIDVFLNALGRLEREATANEPVLALLLVLGGHTDLIPLLQNDPMKPDQGNAPIATHRLHYEASDPILQTCNRLGLNNAVQNRVNVIFIPAYLNGHDGLLDMTYYEALSGCDLAVFPSYYEPWGYTPLESAAYAVPTVTTDQAGFGLWVQNRFGENKGVMLIKRRGQPASAIEDNLHAIFRDFLTWTDPERDERRKEARKVAVQSNWRDFFKLYLKAYDRALAVATSRAEHLAVEMETPDKQTFAGAISTQPHFRTFTAIANLPEKIGRLRELAYNLWWSWNPKARELFISLDPNLWSQMGNNPVRMLESVSPERLLEAAQNSGYISQYNLTLQQFDSYINEKPSHRRVRASQDIKRSSPVAYFSAEYGLHECIPIYSGGLGTLSGDHLKTASDLNIPLVGVGILYKSGFFRQVLDRNGIQVAEYPENDFSNMPVEIVRDDRGNEVQISLDLPGRTLFANIWEVKVGRVSLYLLDTDVPRNTVQDRKITSRLYYADPRTRIEQEILLGMGGVRLLRKLGIRPSVCHINEGHSAFLIFERISMLMKEERLSFDEAAEAVRAGTVFTTHTPVEAGNERFSKELIEHYFTSFVKCTGISWSKFWELGLKESGEDKPFFMTVLALKMSYMSNAVSRVHGQVSRRMWRDVWKGFHESDIPISHVTNGAHLLSYLAPRMREVLDAFLGMDWSQHIADPERWARIQDVPDTLLWRTRYEIKQRTVDFIIEHVSRNWQKYGYSKTWREELFSKINPTAMWIGFARRFAPYKRADMILSNLERLDRIVNHKTHPVHIVFAGKAHPNDEMGKSILKRVVDVCRDDRFRGKIFFIEDYDIRVARRLVQGVDVWLNNPRRPNEASGTSGEKVIINGVLNMSVSDGWWCEGYDGKNGWVVGPVVRDYREETSGADEEDAQSLFSLLENTVVPMYYDREVSGIPEKWVRTIKSSMQTLCPKYNTDRMLLEYYHDMYAPTARRSAKLSANSFAMTRQVADWKEKIPLRFSSLRLLDISVEGILGDTILVDKPLRVTVRVDPGKLGRDEILVELMIGEKDGAGSLAPPLCLPLKAGEKGSDGILTFQIEYVVRKNGSYFYGIRVLPYRESLTDKQETGLVLWG